MIKYTILTLVLDKRLSFLSQYFTVVIMTVCSFHHVGTCLSYRFITHRKTANVLILGLK